MPDINGHPFLVCIYFHPYLKVTKLFVVNNQVVTFAVVLRFAVESRRSFAENAARHLRVLRFVVVSPTIAYQNILALYPSSSILYFVSSLVFKDSQGLSRFLVFNLVGMATHRVKIRIHFFWLRVIKASIKIFYKNYCPAISSLLYENFKSRSEKNEIVVRTLSLFAIFAREPPFLRFFYCWDGDS